MALKVSGTWHPKADFFDFNIKYLFLVGLWSNENWSYEKKLLYKIYQIFLSICAVIYLTITGIGMIDRKDDSMVFLSNMDKAVVAYNFMFKITIFFFKQNKIRDLISQIITSGDQIADDRRKLMVVLVIFMSISTTSLIAGFQMLSQSKGELVVDAWFPFDPFKNSWTLFIAGQILGIVFLVPLVLRCFSTHGIICSITMYICDQSKELQKRLKDLQYSEETDLEMRAEFKEIIKKHIRLMGYAKILKDIFKEYFLVQNLAITAELCLNALMVSIVGLEQKNRSVMFLGFLVAALTNAYIFCHLGNELMDQSAGISMAAYESSWTSWPVDLQKDLLILITVAQKSFKLSAGGIAFMSMQTFAEALYNGYSMFAVLNDIVN